MLAARDAAPRLSAKVAAARDLDTVVMSRREPEFEGGRRKICKKKQCKKCKKKTFEQKNSTFFFLSCLHLCFFFQF